MPEKYCMHCGRKVKESDKFCIFCGKPILQTEEISKTIMDSNKKEKKDKKKNNFEESLEAKIDESEEEKSEEEEEEEDKKGKKNKKNDKKDKKVPFEEEKVFDAEDFDLEPETQKQLEAKMELALLNHKKEKLKDLLKTLMDDAKSERYDLDIDFAKDVNIKLNAVQEVLKEIQKKEDDLREDIGVFIFDELEKIIEERRAQLTELKRKYKLKKIQGNIFEQLKREYASEYRKAQEDMEDLQNQIQIWISRLKTEKNREEIKLQMVGGRFKTKEIEKERYEEEKQKYEKIIEELDLKIEVLRNFTKPRKDKLIKF